MGSGGVAIAALPTVICLKVPFSDGLGGQVSYSVSQMLLPKSFAQALSASSGITSDTFIFIPFAESGVKPSASNGITFISGFT